MQNDETGAQRALTFFTHAGLTRLLEKVRAKYIAEGQVRGQIVLEDTMPGERRELASFLGKPPYRDDTLRIRLVEMDQALRTSGFACSLLDVIAALHPDEPLETRPKTNFTIVAILISRVCRSLPICLLVIQVVVCPGALILNLMIRRCNLKGWPRIRMNLSS